MKKILSILTLTSSLLLANNTNQIQKEYNDYVDTEKKEFDNYQKELNEGFNEYQKELNEGFKNYKIELAKMWKNPELSTKTTFVEYSKDKTIKKKVDYANNNIVISVITNNPQEAKVKMAKALFSLSKETTKQAFNQNPVLSKVNKKLSSNPKLYKLIKATKPSNEPIVSDMIFKKTPTTKKIINFAVNSVKHNYKKVRVSKSKMPNMQVYTMTLPLPSNSLLAKAKEYKSDVFKRAKQFNLTPELVYAIIHTESSFNPLARSYVPAFGLMQLVPKTAGADAYKMLYGSKKILTPSYLYNAHNNILMGSAYLNKIYYGYMRKIKNPKSRLYCTIAAYNTGAGNVACAFNSTSKNIVGKTICRRSHGDYNIIGASSKINTMTPNEVYNHLIKNLRYDEAKNYLKKVNKEFYIYKNAMNKNAL